MEQLSAARRPGEKYWWDLLPEPERIEIKDTTNVTDNKHSRVSQGCALIFFGIVIRIYCFLIGILMVGYGGWVLYEIKQNISPLSILANVAMGGFLLLAGVLTILAETRTRRTMDRCLNTYIILSNHLARGIFYIVVGGLTFPIDVEIPYIGTFGDPKILGGFMVAGGVMNLIYSPFMYRYHRKKELSKHIRTIAFPEEVAYELDIFQYKPQSTPSAPYLGNDTNGAEFEEVDLTSNKVGSLHKKENWEENVGGGGIDTSVPAVTAV